MRPCGRERGERTLAGGPGGGATWFGLRTGDLCNTADDAVNYRKPAQQSTNYWEEPGV